MSAHFNYRVVRYPADGSYAIHEAYYHDGETKPGTVTVRAVGISGNTLEEVKRDLANHARALELPVLDYVTREEIETAKK